jgi:hypothetical protein
MAAIVKQMASMTMLDKIRALTGLGKAGAFNPGAKLIAPKQGTGKRLSPKEREKLRKLREKEERRQRREQREARGEGPPRVPPPPARNPEERDQQRNERDKNDRRRGDNSPQPRPP